MLEQSFFLYKKTKEEKYLKFALRLLKNVNSNVFGENNIYTVYPGLKNNTNLSTNSIDCEIIVDSLCKTIKKEEKLLPKEIYEKTLDSINKLSNTYLNPGIPTKDFSNQRL